MKYYIDYLDKENNFRKTRKDFETYEQAKIWMLENIENFNSDMIRFY
jgi:hypothetical protein